ncbi:uncharacterized protein LOC131536781 [Onychostoma macrolepis]|uniref:uncharacterized protein LOC131536781 n=1 Tax=Onychostoma macrolepis TaxID=369639 RepID=UPI00272B896F|nr:uncharacterized protein LOC131536781 [Onychostoma macrolepis]
MPMPQEEDWQTIAQDFSVQWNFPNCLGAIDGKHVVIQAPPKSGSLFYNYKGTYSIVLLGVVDANYCFRVINVGAYGRGSDGGTLRDSAFGRALEAGTLKIPPDACLPGAEHLGPLPYAFVADEAFPLRRHLLRPYPGKNLQRCKRIFNYRLSRARLVVENAFGILASRFRMYHRVMGQHPHNVEACVKATCVLHNLLRRNKTTHPSAPVMDGPNCSMQGITRQGTNNSSREAVHVRETYTSFFSSVHGEVPWQHLVS